MQTDATNMSLGRHLSHLLTGVDHGKDVQYQRTKQDRKQSFAYVKSYIRKEKWSFLVGMFYLVMGLLIDLAVPAYIGLVTDDVSNGIGGNLVSLSVLILIIIGVSVFKFNSGDRSAVWALGSVLLCSAIWRTRYQAAFG